MRRRSRNTRNSARHCNLGLQGMCSCWGFVSGGCPHGVLFGFAERAEPLLGVVLSGHCECDSSQTLHIVSEKCPDGQDGMSRRISECPDRPVGGRHCIFCNRTMCSIVLCVQVRVRDIRLTTSDTYPHDPTPQPHSHLAMRRVLATPTAVPVTCYADACADVDTGDDRV